MSDNRSYLKNLSQKKYAWMESAATEPSPSSTSPPSRSDDTTTTATTTTTSKRTSDSKKGQASSPPKSRKKQRQKEPGPLSASSSSPASGVSTPTVIKPTKLDKQQHVEPADDKTNDGDDDDNTHHSSETTCLKHITTTATAFAENRSHQPTVRLDQPNFKYTTFPLKGYTILPTRNIASNFVRSDTSYVRGHKAGDAAICPKVRRKDPCVLVSHSIAVNFLIVSGRRRVARHNHHPSGLTQPTNRAGI